MKTSPLLYIALPALLALCTNASAEEYVRTDRYTLATIDPRGDQAAPLTAVVTMTFGSHIQTVGQAIDEILQGSGYRWIVQAGATEDSDMLLNELPLPAVVRAIGPIRLQDALDTIAGESWGLVVNHTNRTLWFELVSAKKTSHKTQP